MNSASTGTNISSEVQLLLVIFNIFINPASAYAPTFLIYAASTRSNMR